MADTAGRDVNRVTSLLALSNANDGAPVTLWADPTTHALIGGSTTVSGTVSGTGTAGTAATGVITVQGIASMTPLLVQGNVAAGATNSGNPVLTGSLAVSHGANPSAVSAGQRANNPSNIAGVPFIIGGHPNMVTIEAAYTSAQTDAAIVAVSTGTIIVVTAIEVTLAHAATVDVGYRVGFGTTNTPTTTGVISSHPGLAPGSGSIKGNGGGIIGIGGDGSDVRITSDVPTTGSLRVVLTYYTIAS